MSKHDIITFGCRLNTYESEVIRKALDDSGQEQPTVVFNSCAVTQQAERDLAKAIRKTRRERPDVRIVVTGCAAQIRPEHYASMKEVDVVLGNEEKFHTKHYQTPANSDSLLRPDDSHALIQVNDIMSVTETASHMVSSFEGRTRAFVQVQNGCNHRCTFCIIPYGRGNSRSVPMGEIVAQVRLLVEQGYKEVVLTGVDISDYGSDLPGKPNLGQMMKRLLALIPELPRLRLSSIDVAEIDDDLLELIANEPRLMPYMHISLQAGDNMILKRMKRRHTREEVVAFCNLVRTLRPGMTFGADIIAGFPTETDEMFANTLNLVKETGLVFLHVFPYSERDGTPAAKMPQLPLNVRKERAAQLRQAGEEELASLLLSRIGTKQEVIIEQDNIGRLADFLQVKFDENLPAGTLTRCKITGVENGVLTGKVLV
ncbi:MAG: mtaB [Rickettsiales bacterium]|jgi:threonylcarbamoyladenosine tRNA methylthiotransferase MtaB|nr:mtaB [Rickettsiales bacterium]